MYKLLFLCFLMFSCINEEKIGTLVMVESPFLRETVVCKLKSSVPQLQSGECQIYLYGHLLINILDREYLITNFSIKGVEDESSLYPQ